jgi:hypothetical protein
MSLLAEMNVIRQCAGDALDSEQENNLK